MNPGSDSIRIEKTLALAGNGDVFAAAVAGALIDAAARNRAGNFVGIDAAIAGGLCKFP